MDKSKLDPEDAVMQVTFLHLTWADEEKDRRTTFIDKNTDISRFAFSTPFTKTGKAFGSVTEQMKRNCVLRVASSFPYLLTAQRVVTREEIILDPIQSSIEDVDERTHRMNSLLDSGDVDPKTLTALLAGSVATQVHGGAKEVCFAFLKERDDSATAAGDTEAESKADVQWNHEDQEMLRRSMRDFLQAARRGLDVNLKLSTTEQQKLFHGNLEQQYSDLCMQINPLIKERKSKKKGGVRFA